MSSRTYLSAVLCRLAGAMLACLFATAAWSAESDRAQLEPLVKRFWAAELKQEYATVFQLLGPRQRAAQPLEEYVQLRKEIGPWTFVAADVKDIAIDGDTAWVNVKFDYTLTKYPSVPKRSLERWQVWRNVDGWYPIAPDEADSWPVLPPKARPAADEAKLKERVEAAWEAKIQQDWKGLYVYLSPAFRSAVPLDSYLKSKAKFIYTAAKVDWAEASGAEAKVRVSFGYKMNDPSVAKMKPLEDVVIEPWVKSEGQWYLDAIAPETPAPQAAPEVAKHAS